MKSKKPWLVRIHYAMRVISFFLLFIATYLQSLSKPYELSTWAFFIAVLLIYPHLQFIRASLSSKPILTEMQNLFIDSILIGAFIAAVQFSQWLAFTAVLGGLANCATNKGWRGVPGSLIGIMLGALAWIFINGLSLSFYTNGRTAIFCMVSFSVYMLALGNFSYARNQYLRLMREEYRKSEKHLISTNEILSSKIAEIDELHHRLRLQANIDPLTGLYNRRYFDVTLEHELLRCQREGHPLAIIMGDLDHFKIINDTYGHQAGDEILIRFGEILRGLARSEDVACRYGGEEFILLMPNMPLDIANKRAEDLRKELSDALVTFGNFEIRCTISIGVAAYPNHGTTVRELISGADNALYQAKHAGRDKVVVSIKSLHHKN